MKILSLDVSGNYSSISLLHDDEVNTFTQTHDRKERPDWDKLFKSIGFDSKEGFENLDGLAFACGPGSYTALRVTASFLKAIAEVKKLGKFRQEGKNYIMKDGDVVNFLFNI